MSALIPWQGHAKRIAELEAALKAAQEKLHVLAHRQELGGHLYVRGDSGGGYQPIDYSTAIAALADHVGARFVWTPGTPSAVTVQPKKAEGQ